MTKIAIRNNKILTDNNKIIQFNTRNIVEKPMIVTDGLIAYYTLDNTLSDSYNNYDLTNFNATYESNGKKNGCYYFNENNDCYMRAETFPAMTSGQNLSIAFWVKTTDNDEDSIIGWDDGNDGVSVKLDDTSYIIIRTRGDNDEFENTTVINDGVWHFIVFVWEQGVEWNLYVDNVLENTHASSDTSSVPSGELYFAQHGKLLDTGYFDGYIDEVRIYNKLLSESEIDTLYNDAI